MSNKTGPVAAINSDETEVRERLQRGDDRRKAFAEWMDDEGKTFLGALRETHRRLAEQFLWNAFKAGERHGRAQLDAILSHGRREA